MKYLFSFLAALTLASCLAKMEKVTSDTRDAVEDTKRGAQLATALEILHDEGIDSFAMRAAAAESVLILAQEDRIHKYLGCTLPLSIGADPETQIPNVSLVYQKGEDFSDKVLPIDPGESAPISPKIYGLFEHATLKVLKDLAMVANKNLAPEKLEDYRAKVVQMIPIATAILGARVQSNAEKYYRDVEPFNGKNVRGVPYTLNGSDIRKMGAKRLRVVADKYQIAEADLNRLTILMSERLAIDFKSIQ